MPLITYADPALGYEFRPNSCRHVRDVTQVAPSFDTNPLCFTIPSPSDSFDSFITSMRSTVNWLAHKKGPTGRPTTRQKHDQTDLSGRNVGPTKVHDYTWTYHCPCFGTPHVTQGIKTNPININSQTASPGVPMDPPATQLHHLVNDPEGTVFRKRKPSYKCGCPSKFMVCQRVNNGALEVEWFWEHLGHNPFTIDNMRRQRMSTPLRAWLDNRVLAGLTWKTVSKLLQSPDLFPVSTHIPPCVAGLLTPSLLELDVSLSQVPEAFKVSYQDVQNLICKTATNLSELDRNVVTSLSKWAVKLRGMGCICHNQISHSPNAKVIFIFMSAWQKEQLRVHGCDLVCIDSTHNTTSNFPQLGSVKVSTFTLLIRHPNTGRGLPVG